MWHGPMIDYSEVLDHQGGDLAGATYASSGCPSTCEGSFIFYNHVVYAFICWLDFVRNNPSQMNNAYFELLWLKVYE
jgi:hypothetical protein